MAGRFAFDLSRRTLGRLGICALVGGLVGAIVGFLFSAVQSHFGNAPVSAAECLQLAGLFGLFAWLFVLVLVGSWLGYGFRAVAVPTLVTAAATTLAVVFALNRLRVPDWGALLGLVIGLLVGWLLCRLCQSWTDPRPRVIEK
ncbi:MAG TPA: hypothetical protein VKD90_04865 [Gemmataceae bacterium]|nr:hypothetical protein [Gemmataceae bacterium]